MGRLIENGDDPIYSWFDDGMYLHSTQQQCLRHRETQLFVVAAKKELVRLAQELEVARAQTEKGSA